MISKFKNIALISLSALTLLSGLSFAGVVYENGPNRVTNDEIAQLVYSGYGQCRGDYRVGQYRYYQVYIRYSGGASGDTGRLSSGESIDSRIASVSHKYVDTLNPWAPQTKFNYGFEKSIWGDSPTKVDESLE